MSVVIPCFNASSTIGATVESALSQEGVQPDIVAVDDGSTDASLNVLSRFGSAVRVISGPHRGASAARNRGIAETDSEWLVFLDSDDILLPETLSKRLDTANETGADVIVCDWQETAGSGEINGQVRSLNIPTLAVDAEIACATYAWATTAALMYRRALVEKIEGFHEDLPIIQDARFMFDAAYCGARFAHSPHVGARYRVRPESLSHRNPAAFWRDVLRNGKQIEALWRARGALLPKQVDALCGIFDNAARGLLAAADPKYFDAVACHRQLGRPRTRHARFTPFMSRALGLNRVRQLLRIIGF